jgi:tetratricopeptide (TPR) repeat protein
MNPRAYIAAARRVMTRPGALADQRGLERVIGWLQPSLDLLPVRDRMRLEGQVMLATALLCRYEHTNDPALLDRALVLLRGYADAYPRTGYGRAEYLATLAWATLRAAEASSAADAVQEAVRSARDGASEYPRDPAQLTGLGHALLLSHERTGRMRALSQAVGVQGQAVEMTPQGDAHRALRLSALGSALARRAVVTGSTHDVQRAVNAQRDAVAAADPADPGFATFLCNLGCALLQEYELGHDVDVLAEAINVHRRALESSHPEHVQHVVRAEGLANALLYRYENFDDQDAATEAVALRRQTLAGLTGSHPMRARVQSNLAGVLLRRSERAEDTDGLDEAEQLMRRALESTEPSSTVTPIRLNLLGVILGRRGGAEAGPETDLDEACMVLREAIEAAPDGYEHLPMFRSNLAVFLTDIYERKQAVDRPGAQRALNEAIGLHRHAVSETPSAHAERGRRVANLALVLTARARWDEDPQILDEADAACQAALASLSEHDPGRAQCLSVAGQIDRCRFELTGDREAGRRAREFYKRAAHDAFSPAATLIRAARSAGILAVQLGDHQSAFEELGYAVDLLERVVSPALRHGDQERLLAELSGLPRDAAALAIATGHPREALALLERGRGVLLGRMTDARTQYDVLAEREPDLAERLREVQGRLDHLQAPATTPVHEDAAPPAASSARSTSDQRAELAQRYQQLVTEIRARPGFDGFLRPAASDQLHQAAQAGPVVVVNVSDHRCDALVLTGSELLHVALPNVTSDAVLQQAERFLRATDAGESAESTEVIEWTWDRIAEPVLQRLGITRRPSGDEPAPRLWWCPTGLAAFLPLHVAGRHDPEQIGGPRSVLDFTASSYIATLRSLIHQRRAVPAADDGQGSKMLAVGVESTPLFPDAPPLAGVQRDIGELSARFAGLTVLDGENAGCARTLAEMARHPYVHFACHGVANLDSPFDAFLQLLDGPLTARQIAARQLPDARLAFVGACETFRGGTSLPDEAISLAAALQLAGYRDVVATQWKVNELFTDTLAAAFYDAAIRRDADGRVVGLDSAAHALREAVLAVRARAEGSPSLYWAPFVHTGP